MTYAALDWTLLQYEQRTFLETIPIWRLISAEPGSIRIRAQKLRDRLASSPLSIDVCESFSLTGGGSAPEEQIPTWVLAIFSSQLSPNQLEEHLRHYEVPILGRIEENRTVLDLRTVFSDQDEIIFRALSEVPT
jgi:L-seryl-tRNA(Ser) seleniumtransferase